MEVCRRPIKSVYDMNQNNSGLVPNFVPSTSNNLTVTFNNQINALHSQVCFHGNNMIDIWPDLETESILRIDIHLSVH